MIVQRFEKGQKFLDLCKFSSRSMDEDGRVMEDECWEVVIWENENRPDDHTIIEYGSETLARMFITMNQWKEQLKL